MDNKDIKIEIGKMHLIKSFYAILPFFLVTNFGHGKYSFCRDVQALLPVEEKSFENSKKSN